MKHRRPKWQAWSPDELPIEPRTFRSESHARAAILRFVTRFQILQGYYTTATGERIPVAELAARCTVTKA